MMNWNEIEVQWTHMTARLKRHWLRLTDADLKAIAGRRSKLISAIERRYGVLHQAAEKQVQDWTLQLGAARSPPAATPTPTPPPPHPRRGARPAERRKVDP